MGSDSKINYHKLEIELMCNDCDNATSSELYNNHVICESKKLHKNTVPCDLFFPTDEKIEDLRLIVKHILQLFDKKEIEYEEKYIGEKPNDRRI